MILYLAGPMSGIRHFNYPAFFSAAEVLREEGYAVINPPESDSPELQRAALASETGDWADLPGLQANLLREIIWKNVEDVMLCDGLAMLPDASRSAGARFEVSLAERLGIPVAGVDWWLSTAPVRA